MNIRLLTISVLLLIFTFRLSAQNSPATRGAVFMIDDYYFETFYNHYDYIQSTGLKMTYFVCYYPRDVYIPYKYILANIFDADNHELGFHGSYHIKSSFFLTENTIPSYMNFEIFPGLMLMTSDGYDISDFSYPYGAATPNLINFLYKYFYFQKLGSTRLTLYSFNEPKQIMSPIPTDENYNISDEVIYNDIDEAYEKNKIIAFYGHQLHDAKVTFTRFRSMFDTLKAKQFHFYRLDDLQNPQLQKSFLKTEFRPTKMNPLDSI